MTEEQVQYVAQSVREILECSRRVRLRPTGAQVKAFPTNVSDGTDSSETRL
jgi:hypothetical protein